MSDMSMDTAKPKRRWNWRRILSNVIILAGIGVLLYLPATWGWAWWQQRGLTSSLEQTHPALQGNAATFFQDGLERVAEQMRTYRDLAEKAEAEAAARARAQAFPRRRSPVRFNRRRKRERAHRQDRDPQDRAGVGSGSRGSSLRT